MTMVATFLNNVGIIPTHGSHSDDGNKPFVMEGAPERIEEAKAKLLKEVESFFSKLTAKNEERFAKLFETLDNRIENCTVARMRVELNRQRKNLERNNRFSKNQLEARATDYKMLLQGFKIMSATEVLYNGATYKKSEPIRRLTKNHLSFLEEVNHGLSMSSSMKKALQLYTEEVQGFLSCVKVLN